MANPPRWIGQGSVPAGSGSQRSDGQSHVDLPVLPPCKTPLRNSIVPAWNSPMQNKISGDLLILHFGGEGALFYENTTHSRLRRGFQRSVVTARKTCHARFPRGRADRGWS